MVNMWIDERVDGGTGCARRVAFNSCARKQNFTAIASAPRKACGPHAGERKLCVPETSMTPVTPAMASMRVCVRVQVRGFVRHGVVCAWLCARNGQWRDVDGPPGASPI